MHIGYSAPRLLRSRTWGADWDGACSPGQDGEEQRWDPATQRGLGRRAAKGAEQFALLLGKAKDALKALNVEMVDEASERGTPLVLPRNGEPVGVRVQ